MHKDEPEPETEGKEPTSVSGEEKKAAGDNDSTVENNIEFSLPKPVKTTKTPNNSDEKEAIAKAADNEPTTTTTDTGSEQVKPETEVTPGDSSGKKPDSPPKSPDQSESKSEIKPEKTIEDVIALKQ